MQFRSKIVAFAVTLAFGAALCATLTLFLARGIENGMRYVSLAEDQLALYLTMETTVSDLLRLHLTAGTDPSEVMMDRITATSEAVRRDIELLRSTVNQELEFRGEEKQEKLERLDQIEAVLNEIGGAFADIPLQAAETGPVGTLFGPLATVVEALDTRLSPLVDLAIAYEASEVFRTRQEIQDISRRSVQAGTTAGILTLLAAVAGIYVLLAAFMRPFDAVMKGASRLADGDLGYRVPTDFSGEFGRLGRDFNVMAERLEASDRVLRKQEENLQRRVAARTAELEEANGQLAAQDATRRRFLADVSHELRTPLTVMRGEAEVALRARDAALSEGAEGALVGVVEQTEHMSRLVDDLLFVARREAGEVPLKRATIELEQILRGAVRDAEQLGPSARIELDADETTLRETVTVDPGRIHQLLMVLFDNALRYSGGTDVRLSAHRTGTAIEIIVRDRGIGIPTDEVPHIFDRFVRGSNAISGGTGLGLPVARTIAEAHGGTLTIESREGEGSAVKLELPRPETVSDSETGDTP